MVRVALDGMAVRPHGRGVTRVLQQLLPLLAVDPRLDCTILGCREGRDMLQLGSSVRFREVPSMTQTMWEQYGLVRSANQIGADAIYSHAECGPLWGPAVLLHVPEDPFVRWQGCKPDTPRERARRVYQRATMRHGLSHASVVAASSSAGRTALASRFGLDPNAIALVPLGVDTQLFHPITDAVHRNGIFHLSSSEARDMTTVVVRAYAEAVSLVPDLPDLLIAGDLGAQGRRVHDTASACGIEPRVHLLGRISDDELRQLYAGAAVCVQPSMYEGFGLQPLEALACGAPLIVFPEAAVEEVVGDAAVVTRRRDETSLASSIAQLWSDTAARSRLGKQGPKRAETFSWVRTTKLVVELLVAMAGHARAPTSPGFA